MEAKVNKQRIIKSYFRAAATLVAGGVLAAYGENLNVSKIVTGTQSNMAWWMEAMEPEINLGAAVQYFPMTSAKISNEATGYFDPGPWSAAWLNSPTSPSVNRSLATAPVMQYGAQYFYTSSVFRQAIASLSGTPENNSSLAFGTGAADAVSSQSIKLDVRGGSHDYFLEFSHPVFTRTITSAYNLISGSNGGTYVYKKPQDAQSRASVTILVDGLPVWSSESASRFPADTANNPWDKTEVRWGKTSAAGTSRLYLGRMLSPSIVVTLVVRTSSSVVMNSCPQDSPSGFNQGEIRCHMVQDKVSMPNLPGKSSSIRVYAKNVGYVVIL